MLYNKDQYKLIDHRFVCVYVDSFFKIPVFVRQFANVLEGQRKLTQLC